MKISKRKINLLLKLTDSKPEDLLKWFVEAINSRKMHPCDDTPYMNKFTFFDGEFESCVDENIVYVAMGMVSDLSIWTIQETCLRDNEFFIELIKSFKKLYGMEV